MKNSLGYKYGFALPKPTLTNPVNVIMVYAQKVRILVHKHHKWDIRIFHMTTKKSLFISS